MSYFTLQYFMNTKNIFLTIIYFLATTNVNAQIGYSKVIDAFENYTDFARIITIQPDGLLLGCQLDKGWDGTFGLLKTDFDGNKIWSKYYSPELDPLLSDYFEKNGKLYITTQCPYPHSLDVWIVCADAQTGDTLWTKTLIDTTYNNYTYNIIPTLDDGILITTNKSAGDGFNSIWLIKTDSLGNTLWDTLVGTKHISFSNPMSTIQLPDSSFMVSFMGWKLPNPWNDDGYHGLIKVDKNGKELWTRFYEKIIGPPINYFNDMIALADGNVLIVGARNKAFLINGHYTSGLFKIEPEKGDTLQTAIVGDYFGDIYDIALCANGDIICAGRVALFQYPNQPKEFTYGGWIYRVTPNLELVWEHYIYDVAKASENEFYATIEAPDGNIYAAGFAKSKLVYFYETWIVKLSADGCIDDYLNCNENLQIYTAISPPPKQGVSPSLRALGGVSTNPAHQTATININHNYTHLIHQGETLEIFNTQGQLVKTIPLSGFETTTFTTANLISGIYYCRLQNHPEIEGVKMVVW